MNKEIAPMEAFKEKVKSKIRDDIADMLPEEVISGLMEEALKEAFFKERKGSYNEPDKPSWFVQLVQEQAEKLVEARAKEFFAERESEIKDQINKILGENSLNIMLGAQLAKEIQNSVYDEVSSYFHSIRPM